MSRHGTQRLPDAIREEGVRSRLAVTRANSWVREYLETTLSCLHVIFEEEWERHPNAGRDLDVIEA